MRESSRGASPARSLVGSARGGPGSEPDLVAVLREVDHLVRRPNGPPVTLAALERRARLRRRRAAAQALLVLTVLLALAWAASSRVAPATSPDGTFLLVQRLRAARARQDVRMLASLHRAERARERGAMATVLYAERVAASDPGRSRAALRGVVSDFAGTRGAHRAALHLASTHSDDR